MVIEKWTGVIPDFESAFDEIDKDKSG